MNNPTLHKSLRINERVSCNIGDDTTVNGTIVGVAWMHVVGAYIVLLDEPISVPGYKEKWRAISIPGGYLEPLDS